MQAIGLSRLTLWFYAIRDGFLSLLPLMFLRVLAQLLLTIPEPHYQAWIVSFAQGRLHYLLEQSVKIVDYTYSVGLTVFVAIHLLRRLPQDPQREQLSYQVLAVSALANFMMFFMAPEFKADTFSTKSIFIGALIGILTTECFRKVAYWSLIRRFRVAYEAEIDFYQVIWLSPVVIFLAGATLLVSNSINGLFANGSLISQSITWILAQSHAVWIAHFVAVLINQTSWFLGFHGWLMLNGYAGELILPPGIAFDGIHIFKPVFINFIFYGGSGATWGLILAIMLATREGYQRRLGRFSILPAIFNISDTLLYGLPIILNPRYLIPFLCVPILLCLVLLLVLQSGWIVPLNKPISWTTPIFLSGWLLTESWRGVFLQIVGVMLSTLMYLPFVKHAEQARQREDDASFIDALEAISKNREQPMPIHQRRDYVGMIARGLMTQLKEDLVHHQLRLYFQPKHAVDGRLIGLEALLRWPNQKYGFIPPQVAISLAEESHIINALGHWVIQQSCAFKQQLNTAGLAELSLAINVSPIQLYDDALVDMLNHNIQRYGLSPQEIELEITESSILPDDPMIDHTLTQLSKLGVRLAIDDFGMGYASLRYLNRFKVSALKIDGSLTKDVLTNPVKGDIIKTIVALGVAQSLDVIAEYVETTAQREMLTAMGCTALQGYLFSQPLPSEDCLHYCIDHLNPDLPETF